MKRSESRVSNELSPSELDRMTLCLLFGDAIWHWLGGVVRSHCHRHKQTDLCVIVCHCVSLLVMRFDTGVF